MRGRERLSETRDTVSIHITTLYREAYDVCIDTLPEAACMHTIIHSDTCTSPGVSQVFSVSPPCFSKVEIEDVERCVRSALDQDYLSPFQVILVDDGH